MNFEDLIADFGAEKDKKQGFVGGIILDQRITYAKIMLGLLRGDHTLLREPLFSDSTLAAVDNITKAIWVAQTLSFCLTQHYVEADSRTTMPLPPTTVHDVLGQCGTTLEEILDLLKMARQLEIEELLKLGAIQYAIERQ